MICRFDVKILTGESHKQTTMIKVIAKFTGKDKSMGYRNGEKYTLELHPNIDGGLFIRPAAYSVDEKPCPYGSLRAFLDNWDVIK